MSLYDCGGQSEVRSGSIFIRKVRLTSGEIVGGHTHKFDHTMIVLGGAISVQTDDDTVILYIGDHFLVEAEVKHEIKALTKTAEFWCVFGTTDPQDTI